MASPAAIAALKNEWHPTRNRGLKFDDLPIRTNLKVWWACSKNAKHEWQARFRNRMIAGYGCPYCSGRKVLREDSFGAQYPKILAEWHPTKNGTLDPFSIRPKSNKRVFPEDSDAVQSAVVIRHDIVHRGGKTKSGKPHNLRESDIESLFVAIENFVKEIDRQLKARIRN
jgi:hypothetical protein